LQFLDVMLGDEPAMDPPTRIYQRLLALDSEEAQELVEQYRNEMPLEQVYDTMLLPALVMAEQDRHRGRLDDRRQVFIRRSMRATSASASTPACPKPKCPSAFGSSAAT